MAHDVSRVQQLSRIHPQVASCLRTSCDGYFLGRSSSSPSSPAPPSSSPAPAASGQSFRMLPRWKPPLWLSHKKGLKFVHFSHQPEPGLSVSLGLPLDHFSAQPQPFMSLTSTETNERVPK